MKGGNEKMNINKIVDALRIIKQVCVENDTCSKCPLYRHSTQQCGLQQRPDCLTISEPTVNIIK